jgi:hypothetical protein
MSVSQNQRKNTDLVVLVDDVNSSSFILCAGLGQIGVEGCADDDVVVAVAVDVQHCQRVAEVGADLGPML